MQVAAAACVWATLWGMAVLLQGWAVAGGEERRWRRVLVEEPWSQQRRVKLESLQLSSVTLCGAACMRQDWCRLWCRSSPAQCLLTFLFVSGSYQPSEPHEALTCYTAREPGMAFGADVTSSGYGSCSPENLV